MIPSRIRGFFIEVVVKYKIGISLNSPQIATNKNNFKVVINKATSSFEVDSIFKHHLNNPLNKNNQKNINFDWMINLTDRISFYSRFVILWFILITVVDVCWWTAISIRTFRITNSWFTPPTLNLIANCFFSDSLDIFRPLEITNSWFTPKSWLNSICELLFQWFTGYLLSSSVNHEFDHILWKKQANLWILWIISHLREQID